MVGIPATTFSFADTTAQVGVAYDYTVVRKHKSGAVGSEVFRTKSHLTSAAIALPIVESRGTVALVVENTLPTAVAIEYNQFRKNLVGDGWKIQEILVPRALTSPNAAQRLSEIQTIRTSIQAVYNADPSNVRAVILLGRVPVPMSGSIGPDGHGPRPFPADVYYGDMTGTWTDTLTKTGNNPGDGMFDQDYPPVPPALTVGRIDFGDLPAFPLTETELIKRYLVKNHKFRHGLVTAQRKAYAANSWGSSANYTDSRDRPAIDPMTSFSNCLGFSNITYSQTGGWKTPLTNNSYLMSYGSGGGTDTSAGGIVTTADFVANDYKTFFMTFYGSYFCAYQRSNNLLRSSIGMANYGLTAMWGNASFHDLALGTPIGLSRKHSTETAEDSPDTSAQYASIAIYDAVIGDPTLRIFTVLPASGVSITAGANQNQISWNASSDTGIVGYHVYRAALGSEVFARLTGTTVTKNNPTGGAIAGLTFTDSTAVNGAFYTYMLRAVKLEVSNGGSSYNLSHGVSISNAPPAIPTGQLFTGNITQSFSQPIFAIQEPTSFAISSGSLPPGLTLNTATGVLSGTPTVAGTTVFGITATNATGSSPSVSLTVTINKLLQTITFAAPAARIVGDPAFALTATSSSGLSVSYTSSTHAVATISGNTVTIVGAGTTTLTASQAGDATYAAATNVTQVLTVLQVGEIPILNGGFENSAGFNNATTGFPATSSWQVQTANLGNTEVKNNAFTGKEGDNYFLAGLPTNTTGIVTNGWLSSGSLGTFAANTTYTLTVRMSSQFAVANLNSFIGLATDITLASLVGQTSVPTSSMSQTAFTDYTYVLDTAVTTSVVGQPIRIFLGQTSTQVTTNGRFSYFDNVRLVAVTAPVVTASQTASGTVSSAFSYQVVASNTPTSFALASGSLPAGVTLNTATGVLSGTPTASGTFTPSFTATNASGTSPAVALTLTISLPVTPVITPDQSASGTVGSAFSYQITASNTPTSYALSSGSLPAGVTLNTATGLLSGTPSASGTFTPSFTTTNAAGTSSAVVVTLTISTGSQTITFASLATKTVGDPTFNLSATASSGLTVSYTSSNLDVATILGNTVTVVGVGSSTITASQAGNANFAAAANVTRALTVNPVGQVSTIPILNFGFENSTGFNAAVVGFPTTSSWEGKGGTAALGQGILAVDFGNINGAVTSNTQSGFQAFNINQSTTAARTASFTASDASTITVNLPVGNTTSRDRGAVSGTGSFTYSNLYRDLAVQIVRNTGAAGGAAPTLAQVVAATSMSLTGLTANQQYTIRLWSVNPGNDNNAVNTWFNLTPQTFASQLAEVSLGSITNLSASNPTSNTAYSISATVTSNQAGALYFRQALTAGSGHINGFQLSVDNTEVRTGALTGKQGNNYLALTADAGVGGVVINNYLHSGSLGTFAADTTYTLTVAMAAENQDRLSFIGLATGTTTGTLAGQTSVNSQTMSSTTFAHGLFI